jgi:hypothetical protein
MNVYRLEDPKTGLGPYNSSKLDSDIQAAISLIDEIREKNNEPLFMWKHDRCPSPLDSFDSYKHLRDWSYGFASLAELQRWFTDVELEILGMVGFVVRCYNVDMQFVEMGRQQLRFDKSKATLINTYTSIAEGN